MAGLVVYALVEILSRDTAGPFALAKSAISSVALYGNHLSGLVNIAALVVSLLALSYAIEQGKEQKAATKASGKALEEMLVNAGRQKELTESALSAQREVVAGLKEQVSIAEQTRDAQADHLKLVREQVEAEKARQLLVPAFALRGAIEALIMRDGHFDLVEGKTKTVALERNTPVQLNIEVRNTGQRATSSLVLAIQGDFEVKIGSAAAMNALPFPVNIASPVSVPVGGAYTFSFQVIPVGRYPSVAMKVLDSGVSYGTYTIFLGLTP